ncbi:MULTISPECIES: hypothetical protein [Myxococcus]|uniref:hypothetical protein n=1 Tax=Myxococcus TaxID=32 RepID=UPI001144D7F3|nr:MULTISPECIES: hypothetical protein [Myxococcus]MCK8496427.1 hypothetical protein [Myxococcus fulvus]
MSIRQRFRLGMLTVALLGGWTASATTQLRVDVTQLSQEADAVVHGVVRRVESRWSGDGRRIVTDIEVQVTDPLKGQPGSTVLVTQPGGEVGDVGQTVHGLATFKKDEEVVVFLRKRGASAFRVAGMAQGKFQVRRDEAGKPAMVIPEHSDALLLDPVTRKPTTATQKPRTLEELKATVRAALKKGSTP